MFKRLILLAVAGVMVASTALASVTTDVKKAVDEIIRIVSDKEMKKPSNVQKRRAAIKKTLSTIFDQQEMAKRSLGKHWNKLTPEERRQFVDLFAALLENSYADKIESYNNERIVYLREQLDDDYAEVKSKVITTKNEEFTLDYKLLKKGNNRWVVYDVVIEGVSLVSNYRTQFNNIISSSGYPELVKKLKSKGNDLKAP